MTGPAPSAALALSEVNPTQDPGGELLARYIDGVTAAFAEPVRNRQAGKRRHRRPEPHIRMR